jgi:hypothetical protein
MQARRNHALGRDCETVADDAYRLLRAVVNTPLADGLIVRSPCRVTDSPLCCWLGASSAEASYWRFNGATSTSCTRR